MMRLSRRRALQIGTATAVLAAAGGYMVTRRPEDLVLSILERHFGPVRMPGDDLTAFTQASLARRPWLEPPWKLGAVFGTAYEASLDGPARRMLPEDAAAHLEQFERHVLGDAVRLTDIAMRSDPEAEVTFLGPSACLNPYARFETA